MLRTLVFAVCLSAVLGRAAGAEERHWTWCGWGGGGWFWSSAADPADGNVFYMGGDVDGIWKTTDAGRNWSFVNRGLGNYAVYSLAVAPSDGRFVYALTGNGVAASTNGAASWTMCKETASGALKVVANRGGSIHALAVDPTDSRTVYAGGGSGRAVKSADGGATWTVLDFLSAGASGSTGGITPDSGAGCGVISVSAPANDWSGYVAISKTVSQSGADWSGYAKLSVRVFLPADAPSGMNGYVVLQSGNWTWAEGSATALTPGTWTTVEAPLSNFTDSSKAQLLYFLVRNNGKAFTGRMLVDAYALVRADGSRTSLGEWDGSDLEGWAVHNSTEAKAFTKGFSVSNAPTDTPSGSPICSIAVSGDNRNLVLLCEQKLGLFRSTDAGATWQKVTGAPEKARAVYWAGPKAPKTWYGAFDSNGVYVSSDDGLTWTALATAPASGRPARDIACSRQDPSVIHVVFTSSFNSHTATSRDGGATWTSVSKFTADHAANPTLPDNGATGSLSGIENICVSPVNANNIHIPGNWDPCFSTDAGATWVESCRGADITCFHDIRFLDGAVYGAAMDEGTCMSVDGGANWTALLPLKWKAGLSGHHWRVLPQRLSDGRTRILSTVSPWDDSGIKYPVKVVWSEDGGKTFTEAKGLPDYRPIANTMWGEGHGRALAANPANPDIIYLGIDGDPENGKCGGGVFKSTDGGKTFAQLPNQPGSRRMYYGLAVDPTDTNRIVWGACGDTAGVYVSEDGGASWSRASGLYDWIYNVEITPSGVIYASGNQLYRSDNHGRSFSTVSHFPSGTVLGIAVDPANEDRVWASAAGWDDNAVGGIYESTDGCANWTEITGDIPYVKPCVLRYDAESGSLWAAGNAAFRLQVDAPPGPGGDDPDEPPPADGECIWTGRVDGDWHNPDNWRGGVPGPDDAAVFSNAMFSSGSTVTITSAVSVAKLIIARTGGFTLGAAGEGALSLGAIERRDVPGDEATVTVAVPLTLLPDENGDFLIDLADGGLKLSAKATKGEGLVRVVKTGGGLLELAAEGALPSGTLAILAGTVTPRVNKSVTGKLVVGGGTEPASFTAGDRLADGVTPYVYTNGTFSAGDHVSGGPNDFHVFEGGYAYLKATYGGKVELTGGTMDIGYRIWNGEWGQHLSALKSDTTARLSGAMTAANFANYTFPVKVEDGARPIDFVFTGSLSGDVPKFTFSGGGTMKTTGSWDISANPSLTSMTWLMDNVGKTAGSGKGNLTVGADGTLGGTGTFGGAVASQVLTVSGTSAKPATLAPGTMTEEGEHVYGTFAVGSESVTNTLVLGTGSRLLVTVGSDGCDALRVNGVMRIAESGSVLQVAAADGFAGGGPIVLAEATGGIVGDFATLILPEGEDWTVRRTATRIELAAAHPSFAIGADLPEGVQPLERRSDGSYVVRLGASLVGFTYALEYATTLEDPEWLPVEGAVAEGGSAPLELSVPAALTADQPALFLRVTVRSVR